MTHPAILSARNWLGTPFCTGASARGFGADCAGLIEGIAHDLNVPYPDRLDVSDNILEAAHAFLVPTDKPAAGCIILLAAEPGGPPLHGAIVTDVGTLIHAHWRAGVVENRFGDWFVRRVTHVFAWPIKP